MPIEHCNCSGCNSVVLECEDLTLCKSCWDKRIEEIGSYEFPCSDHSCVFTQAGGMGTNGGCMCLEDFPMNKRVRHLLKHEIRCSNIRALRKGRQEVIRWFERAIADKIWDDEGAGETVEKQFKFMLERMRFEL